MILAMTGKGGVGKTTLSALALNWLAEHDGSPILAVDADCNANLNEALGVKFDATVGGIRESVRKEVNALKGVSKQEFLDLRVQEALVEHKAYDLIVMGRPEGQGCYCFANNALRDILNTLARNYKNIVIDSEAGLEHISRRTLLKVDYLLIVSDCTVRGIHTAARISALADEVQLPAQHRGLIVNRVPGGTLSPAMADAVKASGLPLLATIPLDPDVAALDADGIPVSTIPANAPARIVVNQLLATLYQAQEGNR
jgi:CO dehydrogenase maturation factor